MAISRRQFIKHLTRSGVMTPEEVEAFMETLTEPPADGEQLAKALIRGKRLTPFQAQRIYQGKYQGLLLADYLILDAVGAGGMGQVYLAEHRRMRRRVALKTLPAAVAKDEATVRRFHREVRAAARLAHPNIVTAFDAGEDKGIHYFVMEHVDGTDLSRLVRETGKLSITDGIDFTLQAARGLAYAHQQGIVHRDIKPSNLLIDKQRTVKVLDMGLARIETEADGVTGVELTQTGAVMGTVDYMAPEQALDTKHADARSDIYSLGCSLYFLLTGQTVFGGDTIVKKIFAHRDAPIPALCQARPSLPVAAGKVFERMLAKNPDDRYQSMEEVVTALETCGVLEPSTVGPAAITNEPGYEQFLHNLDVVQTPTTLQPPPRQKRPGEHETVPSGILDDTLLGGIGEKQRLPRKPLQQPPWWHNRWVLGGGAAALLLLAGILITITRPDGTQTTVNVPEGSDVAIDGKGNVNVKLPGTAAGATAGLSGLSSSAGAGNHALLFDGVDDVVGVPTLQFSGSQVLTIETTVRLLSPEREPKSWMTALIGGGLLTIRHFSSPSSHFWEAYGVQASNGQYVQQSVHLDQTGTVHLAAVYDGRRITTFANGKRSAQALRQLVDDELKAASEIAGLMNKAGLATFIGSEGTTRYLHGVIDEVRISNVARYTADFTPQARFEPDEYTLALYHFDEAEGTILHDASGNGHHGTIHGASWVRVDEQLNVIDEPSTANHALSFDGQDDYVAIPTLKLDGSHPVTVEATVRLLSEPEPNLGMIAVNAGGLLTLDRFRGQAADGHWQTYGYDSTDRQQVFQAADFDPDKSVHLAAVYDLKQITLFINGQRSTLPLRKQDKDSGKFENVTVINGLVRRWSSLATFLGVGDQGNEKLSRFHGLIDEIRISNVARYTEDFTPLARFEPDEHTLALYHFDEAEGNILHDASGNGHHGTIHGATWVRVDEQLNVIDEPPPANHALQFDGEDDYVDLPVTYDCSHPITIEVAASSSRNRQLEHSRLMYNWFLSIYATLDGTWHGIGVKGPDDVVKIAGHIPMEAYGRSHVALVFDGAMISLFVNGERRDSTPYEFRKTGKPHGISIGGDRLWRFFHGIIDEVRISNVARYTEGFTPQARFEPDEHTLALYHFDEAEGNILHDASGNGHHGTIHGATWVRVDDQLNVVDEPASNRTPVDPERAAAELVLKLGGTIRIHHPETSSTADLSKPEELPIDRFAVGRIDLGENTRLRDSDLAIIGRLRAIQVLNLASTAITNRGIALLSSLTSLRQLVLGRTQVTSGCITTLQQLPGLRDLTLPHTSVADGDKFAMLPNLRHLSLGYTLLSADAIKKLVQCRQLNVLEIQGADLNLDSLSELSRLSSLQSLNLAESSLGDDEIPGLAELSRLSLLDVRLTSLSEQGVRQLEQALPDCCVISDYMRAAEPDLEVAKKVLALQGSVRIALNFREGLSRTITAADQLPEEPFRVKTLKLPPGARAETVRFASLKCIEYLFCPETPNSQETAEWIRGLRSLNDLHFDRNDVSAEVLRRIAELPNLDQLYLTQCRGLDDATLAELTKLKQLWLLNLVETDIHGSRFEHLSKLQELRHLNLDRCLLTHSEGIAELARLPYLRELYLRGCGLGDEALPYLKQLSACRALFLNGNPITPAAVHELQAALPDCVVFHDALKDVPVPPRDVMVGTTAGSPGSAGAKQPRNHALSFDGEDDYVEIPGLVSQRHDEEFTFELFVRPTSAPTTSSFPIVTLNGMRLEATAPDRWRVFGKQLDDFTKAQAARFRLEETDHLAVVVSHGEVALFANGRFIGKTPAPRPQGSAVHRLGGNAPQSEYFHGLIDEVRISNVARYTEDFTPQARLETDEHTLALYHFDEAEGNILHDASGNGHHGTIHSATWVRVDDELNVIDEPPPVNHALSFDGEGDFVEVPLSYAGSNPLTVEVSARLDELTPVSQLIIGTRKVHFGLETNDDKNESFWKFGLRTDLGFGDNPQGYVGYRRIETPGRYVQLAAVRDLNEIRFYVNGEATSTATFGDPPDLSTARVEVDQFTIGALRWMSGGNSGYQSYVHGIIDEVRISNIARYTKDFRPQPRFEPDEHTLALYHFDEAEAHILHDASGNGHHGTIHGASWVRVDDQLNVIDEVGDEATPLRNSTSSAVHPQPSTQELTAEDTERRRGTAAVPDAPAQPMNEAAGPAPAPMAPDSQPSTPLTGNVIQVGPGEGMVNTLGEAFAQAEGGDTIEICQDEPLQVDGSKTDWKKPGGLTICNGEGFQPVLVQASSNRNNLIAIRKSESDNQKLQLLGLTFVDLVSDRTGVLVYAEPGAVAKRCLFISLRAYSISGGCTAMGGVELRNCYLWRPRHPVASAMAHCIGELQISDTLLAGDGALGLREENRTSVFSTSLVGIRNAFVITGTTHLNSERNLFANLDSVISLWTIQLGDITAAQSLLPSYRGQSNLYFSCERFAPDLAPKSAADLAVWQQFTGNGEKSPVLADPQFARPDLVAQCRQRLLPPAAFRLKPTSPARRRNIGCDVSKLPDLPPALIDLLPADMRPPAE